MNLYVGQHSVQQSVEIIIPFVRTFYYFYILFFIIVYSKYICDEKVARPLPEVASFLFCFVPVVAGIRAADGQHGC